MSVIHSLIKAHFVATDAQVEALARDVVNGDQAGGTYLKVLVVACQTELSHTRRLRAKAAEAVIDKVHGRFYPHVLKGVGNEELPVQERNRRATFARTAVSTLRAFVRLGGDIRKLEVEEVTKQGLRCYGRKVPTGTRFERSMHTAAETMIRAAQHLAKEDVNDARTQLEAQIELLQEALDKLEGEEKPTRARTRHRARTRQAARATRAPRRTPRAPSRGHVVPTVEVPAATH